MFHKIIYIISFVTLGIADTFLTSIGECTLEIYGGRIEDLPEIVQLVKKETDKLVREFGSIEQRQFSIYITSNMEEFYNKSHGPVPEWGIAIAKLN